MDEVNLKLTIKEANLILKALGNMPFIEVQQLIGKVQTQAQKQLKKDAKNG